MTDSERVVLLRVLDALGHPPLPPGYTAKWVAIWTLGLSACVMIAGVLFARIEEHTLVLISIPIGIVMVVGFVCVYAIIAVAHSHFHWARIYRVAQRTKVPRIRAAISRGTALVTRVVASEVVVIEEYEDEGTGYIFDIGEGRALFLKGQQYHPVVESMEWPNSHFEIVRGEDGEVWIGVFCYGERLMPTEVIPSSRCRDDIVWTDREEILEGSLRDLCAGLIVSS